MYFSRKAKWREGLRLARLASLPECPKCDTGMFTITESRFHHSVRCPICGKTLTLRKRG